MHTRTSKLTRARTPCRGARGFVRGDLAASFRRLASGSRRRFGHRGAPSGCRRGLCRAISVTSMRSVDYDLITFEPEQARAHAEALVALGHPEWEGRLSGTGEEGAAADLVIGNLFRLGDTAQRHEFDVPMFAVESEPSLSVCEPPVGIGRR